MKARSLTLSLTTALLAGSAYDARAALALEKHGHAATQMAALTENDQQLEHQRALAEARQTVGLRLQYDN
ncbi:hypothetical protein NHH03_03225 [Stieleria sp. TO1_6]|uniref:hypothetical protein n=1 Tax=Stieleria tagensis TaxID=2956795 RepID=UPI00209BAE45|nr:hypothetical protein [Stieleria tagensis]MCO8120735.1 hypothetical protein [Stieleria tagensis]